MTTKDRIERVFKDLDDLLKKGELSIQDLHFMRQFLGTALRATRELEEKAGIQTFYTVDSSFDDGPSSVSLSLAINSQVITDEDRDGVSSDHLVVTRSTNLLKREVLKSLEDWPTGKGTTFKIDACVTPGK